MEPVMIRIPKRSIENWIHYFRDDNVTEADVFVHGRNLEKCKEEAKQMLEFLQDQTDNGKMLPSLLDAKAEFCDLCIKQC